jgi:hypothetical protein
VSSSLITHSHTMTSTLRKPLTEGHTEGWQCTGWQCTGCNWGYSPPHLVHAHPFNVDLIVGLFSWENTQFRTPDLPQRPPVRPPHRTGQASYPREAAPCQRRIESRLCLAARVASRLAIRVFAPAPQLHLQTLRRLRLLLMQLRLEISGAVALPTAGAIAARCRPGTRWLITSGPVKIYTLSANAALCTIYRPSALCDAKLRCAEGGTCHGRIARSEPSVCNRRSVPIQHAQDLPRGIQTDAVPSPVSRRTALIKLQGKCRLTRR